MISIRCITLVFSILLLLGCGAESIPYGQVYEEAGGFSYDPPKDWKVRPSPSGLEYNIVVGPDSGQFTTNINIIDEEWPGSLKQYLAGNIKSMKKQWGEDFKIIEQGEFAAYNNLLGYRLVAENLMGGMHLRHIYYTFAIGNKKYVVTCATLADNKDTYDTVFDASIRTFRVH